MHRLVFVITFVRSLLIAGNPSPTDWMPGAADQTQLWWTDGPPKMLSVSEKPASQTLGFQFGGEKMLFDTQNVRPMDGEWECAVIEKGRRFECVGHIEPKDEWLQPVRFVECGRFFQRVVLEGLKFAAADGSEWQGQARLEITAWPDRLAFRLESETDATLLLRHGDKRVDAAGSALLEIVSESSTAVVESELPVTFDAALGCHRLALPEQRWSNAGGTFYPEEHLDRIDRWRVTLRNDTDKATVARLMFTQEKHLPITGFTPMLCDADGTPTGLLVQLSKNWHIRAEKGHLPHEGPWFHGFAWVRVPPKSKRDFVFQMVYARYGGVCAASHAQLCLIGWGHNQFWDQAAIGSFGESICFEPGRVQRRCFITDVRPLMTLPRDKSQKPWGWAENCGGGDFLMWQNADGQYQRLTGTRIDYRAHGPCLTDVRYSEQTMGGEFTAQMNVSVPAANDHLRTLLHLRYDVHKPVRWQRLAFFQMGADFYNDTPARKAAIGDISGLRDEWEPRRAKDEFDRKSMPLTGSQPWISMHAVEGTDAKRGAALATRGLIVRSWKAVVGGREAAPHASFFSTEWGKNNHKTTVELSLPPDIDELRPGDFVEADLEFIVLPADASAYYGPDKTLRDVLSRDADTWRVVHREAAANQLLPTATQGRIVGSYPIVIEVNDDQVADLTFQGGAGHIPVVFTGLKNPRGFQIQVDGTQEQHLQTDWDAEAQRWRTTVNVPASTETPRRISLKPSP